VEQRALTRPTRRVWVGGGVALVVALGIVYGSGRTRLRQVSAGEAAHAPPLPTFAGDAHVHVPGGVRVTVEVLNATHIHGLARHATLYLRDHGFDVVLSGTVPDQQDTTVVLDRSGHPDWAALAARALGRARAEERPDSLRDVDLTVLLGASWRPPAEPFYP